LYTEFSYQTIFHCFVGFTEKAYACWQAMMEITFFTPNELQSSNFEDITEGLEEFWGSERPRFGEKVHITRNQQPIIEHDFAIPCKLNTLLLSDREHKDGRFITTTVNAHHIFNFIFRTLSNLVTTIFARWFNNFTTKNSINKSRFSSFI